MNYFDRLKTKWNITSNIQLIVILVVFSVTGSASLFIARPVLSALHITKESLTPWLYYPLRVMIIFPVYQVLLIVIGTLLGQFRFFWKFERTMFGRLLGQR